MAREPAPVNPPSTPRRGRQEQFEDNLQRFGNRELFDAVEDMIRNQRKWVSVTRGSQNREYFNLDYSWYEGTDLNVAATLFIGLDMDAGGVNIGFCPIAIHLAEEEFNRLKNRGVEFEEGEPAALIRPLPYEYKFPINSLDDWQEHQAWLTSLTQKISQEYDDKSRGARPSRSSANEAPEEERVPDATQTAALNVILYGPPGTGKTWETTGRCVRICDGTDAPAHSDQATVRARYNQLVEEGRVEFVTFHQSYGYEEFVEGLRPRTGAGAGFSLQATDGVLKRIAARARDSGEPHVLVIDEINRANVSKVMGELVTLLEEDKRAGADNEVGVTLPHSGERFTLPANLHLLGTMNTADRSIALLDTALRRRFQFEELAPDPDLLEDASERTGIDLGGVLRAMNERLEWLLDRDHLIGHAWLMNATTRAEVDDAMRRKIIPLLAEYFYDDWAKVRAVLGGGPEFVRSERLSSPPGLEQDGVDEERYRWTVRAEFPRAAYDRLIARSTERTVDVE